LDEGFAGDEVEGFSGEAGGAPPRGKDTEKMMGW